MKLTETIETEYENITSHTQSNIRLQKISPTLERELLKAYKRSVNYVEGNNRNQIKYSGDYSSFYVFAYNRLEKISFTQIDISLFYNSFFSKGRESVGGEKSIFLTAMVQAHFDKTKTTEEYSFLFQDISPIYFGYRLDGPKIKIARNVGICLGQKMHSGSIRVLGNAGNYCGEFMHGGNIHIEGNAKNNVGNCMDGGNIIINGNVLDYAGMKMSNGKITVHEGAQYDCCEQMTGGTFSIDGTVTNFSDEIFGGTVIHNGEKIFPRE